jgi:hypothetical protein
VRGSPGIYVEIIIQNDVNRVRRLQEASVSEDRGLRINKDTKLCMSLASRPGNFGTRLHNFLYAAMDLNYLYKAFTITDLKSAIAGIRALAIRGCAISMPFKEEAMQYLDHIDPSAARIRAVNTIVNDDGVLTGFNTDYWRPSSNNYGAAPLVLTNRRFSSVADARCNDCCRTLGNQRATWTNSPLSGQVTFGSTVDLRPRSLSKVAAIMPVS